jgi:DNA invertase Pin-like site-specific DNA recombinase
VSALLEYARRRPDWKVVATYRDTFSGSADKRPGLDALMADALRRRFDVVLVWKFDRFARSTRQLVTAAEVFKQVGIDFVSAQEAIDTTTPYGRITFVILSAVAEIEKSFIQERAELGRARARAAGKHCGRPRAVFDRGRAADLRGENPRLWTWRKLAKEFGRSKDTMAREISKFRRQQAEQGEKKAARRHKNQKL